MINSTAPLRIQSALMLLHSIWLVIVIMPLAAQPARERYDCSEQAVRALGEVREKMDIKIGMVVSYRLEVRETGSSRDVVVDTITIVRTPKVILMKSSEALSISDSRIGYQISDKMKKIVVYRQSRTLQQTAQSAHEDAMRLLVEHISSSSRRSCVYDTSANTLITTAAFEENGSPQLDRKTTIDVGGNFGQLFRRPPTSITVEATPTGAFVSLSSTYTNGPKVQTVSISSLNVHQAEPKDIAKAESILNNVLSDRGAPARVYQGYTVLDLRPLQQSQK